MNRWLVKQFGRALVRRVAFIVVAALLAVLGMGNARADSRAPDIQTASAWCEESAAAASTHYGRDTKCIHEQPLLRFECEYLSSDGSWKSCRYFDPNQGSYGTNEARHGYPRGGACPDPQQWNHVKKKCVDPSECLLMAPLGNSNIPGGFGACKDGCAFSSGKPVTVSFGDPGKEFTHTKGWKPTGNVCTPDDKAPSYDAECQDIGIAGQTVCVLPDGRYCPSTSTDRSICWTPGETGEKTDHNFLQKTNAGDTPIPPSFNLESGDTLSQSGEPLTTTVTSNTTTTTTTTTNYNTEYGTNVGDKNQGGEGGSGSGSGNGDGSGDGDGDGPGGVGDGVGSLYEGSDKTVEGVMSDFRSQAMNSTLFGSITGFMGDCAFGGTCPVWSYDGGEYMGKVTFDGLCSGSMQSLFSYGGFIVMALAAFAAFRVAIY